MTTEITIDIKGPGGITTVEAALLKDHLESFGAKVTINDPDATGSWEMTPERVAEVKERVATLGDKASENMHYTINVTGYPWGG